MSVNIELLKQVRIEQLETASFLQEKIKNISRDKNGGSTAGLSSTLRMIAILDFLLDKNVESFRNRLVQSTNIFLKLFERFDAGEGISPSYVSILTYKELLDALASNDISLAEAFAQKMGGRYELEKEYDIPFTIAIGYTLKYLVLNDDKSANDWLKKLLPLCEGKMASFKGYAAMIAAIIHKDEAAMNAAIPMLVEGHKKESKGQGMFSDLLDEHLAIWAIGLANLAKNRGLNFKMETELIPRELIG